MNTLFQKNNSITASFSIRPDFASPVADPEAPATPSPARPAPTPAQPSEPAPLTPAPTTLPAPFPPFVRPKEGEEVETC